MFKMIYVACIMFLWDWAALGLEDCPCHQGGIPQASLH